MRRSSRGASSPRRTARRRGRSSAARARGRSRGHYMMTVVRRLVTLVILVALASVPVAHAAPAAPAVRVKLVDGRTFDSRDALGKKVVVLRFQASYCKPCVKESAALSKITER